MYYWENIVFFRQDIRFLFINKCVYLWHDTCWYEDYTLFTIDMKRKMTILGILCMSMPIVMGLQ